MKALFSILLLTCSLVSFGQKGKFKPFKLIVLKPDTAIIDKSLYADIDSVESDYLKRYYSSMQEIEQTVNSNAFQNDTSFKTTIEEMKKELVKLKAYEPEIKKFKYFHSFSAFSTEVYNFYFNEYEPFSQIIELPNQNIDLASLRKLADSSKADYIVFFTDIHTEERDGLQILKLTSSLYSKKDNKIILKKETEGDRVSRGSMWTCGSIELSCLLINAVRTSTDEIAPLIAKAQIRQ